MNNDFSEYKNLFLQTAQDYIGQIETALQTLKQNSSDSQAIETIHIAAHSLKSQNLAMGFTSSGNVFLKIEKLFEQLENEKTSIPENLQRDLQLWIQALQGSLESIKQSGKEKNLSNLETEIAKYDDPNISS